VFRVIIILPNFPEGSFFAPEVRMVMKWTYETICRGDTSLLAQLQRAGVNIPEYISFHQLRSWGHLDQVPLPALFTRQHDVSVCVRDVTHSPHDTHDTRPTHTAHRDRCRTRCMCIASA
jgi:phospholipase D1/2